MVFGSLRSKFGSWHRDEHLMNVDTDVKLSPSSSSSGSKRASGSLIATSDIDVELIGVRNIVGNTCSSPFWNYSGCDSGSCDFSENSNSSGFGRQLSSLREELKRQATFVVEKTVDVERDVYNTYFEGALHAASTGDAFYLERCIRVLGIPVNAETSRGVTMLHCALVKDQVDCVRLLLRHGADPLKTTIKGRSSLHTASRFSAVNSLKLLLCHLCGKRKELAHSVERCMYTSLFLRDQNGDTPFHLACRVNDHRCLKALLKTLVKKLGWTSVEQALFHCNVHGQNPLHVACVWRNTRIIRFFITADFENAFGRIPFSTCSRKCAKKLRQSLIKTLLSTLQRGTVLHEMVLTRCLSETPCTYNCKGEILFENSSAPAVFSSLDETALKNTTCAKCEKGLQNSIELLLSKCPELIRCRNDAGLTPLMVAVINDSFGATNALISKNVNIEEEDSNCRTALHHASSRGITRQVAILLAEGASASHRDIHGVTPLHLATVRSFTSCLRLLYRANCLIDVRTPNGQTAFMWAATYGVNASLLTMLEVNPMLDRYEKDNEGRTALHLAAARNQFSTVKLLVDSGWYVEARNFKEETPLLAAAANGCADAVRELLNFDADVYAVDENHNTVFHLAAVSDMHIKALVELLLVISDMDILNYRNSLGDTPVLCAVKAGAVCCLEELLKRGAIVHLRNLRGWNPLMVALQGGFRAVICTILSYSPDVNCFSAMDGCSPLTLAIDLENEEIIDRLKMLGAKLPCEIVDEAASRIQRWYRRHLRISFLKSGGGCEEVFSLDA